MTENVASPRKKKTYHNVEGTHGVLHLGWPVRGTYLLGKTPSGWTVGGGCQPPDHYPSQVIPVSLRTLLKEVSHPLPLTVMH